MILILSPLCIHVEAGRWSSMLPKFSKPSTASISTQEYESNTDEATSTESTAPKTVQRTPFLRITSDADTTTTKTTTTSTLESSAVVDGAIIDDPNDLRPTTTSLWSRFQRRVIKGASFDIVPLPKRKQKKQSTAYLKNLFNQQHLKSTKKSRKRSFLSGTKFDLRPPSSERLSRWFGGSVYTTSADARKRQQCDTPTSALFNHDSVGMTNPMLHISALESFQQDDDDDDDGTEDDQSSAFVSLASSTTTAVKSNQASDGGGKYRQQEGQLLELQDSWIPSSSTTLSINNDLLGAERAWFPPTQQEQQRRMSEEVKKIPAWRQCRYRRRVGQGQACYERVREAALAWQFNRTDHPTQGILPVHCTGVDDDSNHDNKKQKYSFQLDSETAQHVQPLWSGPHIEGSRRLVTFTSSGFKAKWLPKLYTMNPVMVVYDLIDQRCVLALRYSRVE